MTPCSSRFRFAALLVCAALLTACEHTRETGGSATPAESRPAPAVAPPGVTVVGASEAPAEREAFVEPGTGVFFDATAVASTTDPGPGVALDFEDTPLREFVGVVLGEMLNENYLIDPAVDGTVTLRTAAPVSQGDLLPLLQQILEMNNAVMRQSNGFYQVLPASAARPGRSSPTIAGASAGGGDGVRIFPLEYIAAAEMRKLLQPVVADINTITVDSTRNLLMASGSNSELRVIEDTIAIFDVDWLRGMSVALYPLDHVDPEALEEELSAVFAGSGGDEAALLNGLVRLIPMERLGSLLVVSSTPTALREVEGWIRRLDQPSQSANKKLFVYRVQNASATELADILGRILAAASGRSTTQEQPVTLAPGLTATELSSEGDTSADTVTGPSGAAVISANRPGLANLGDVQIIADDVRNSLVILAEDKDYAVLQSAIEALDIIPLQVHIEASIIEVTLRDDLSYGVEWFFRNRLNSNEFQGNGRLDLGSSGISALAPGFSYTVLDSSDQVRIALNTLAAVSEVNVLSSPSLMVLDNQTALINVGDEIPVPTRQSVSNIDPTSPTVNEISFRQTGITLTVKPRVNNSGLVTMDISQEVSSAATTTTSNLDAPTIQNRQIQSVVAVLSGETIILGGLMLEQEAVSESGLPLLHKIPVMGNLFSQKVNEKSRTELLVLITPKVVRNQLDARSITDEYRSRLMNLPAQ